MKLHWEKNIVRGMLLIIAFQAQSADGDAQRKIHTEEDVAAEVLNKTGGPVWVMAYERGLFASLDKSSRLPLKVNSYVRLLTLLDSGSRQIRGFHLQGDFYLAIWTIDPLSKVSEKILREEFENNCRSKGGGTWFEQKAPVPDFYNKFTAGKTVYITVDKDGVRPQTGPDNGRKGVTNSELSLDNNVTVDDIAPLIWK